MVIVADTGVKGYRDIAAVCREQIRSGTWKTGERIPTMRTLSERFGVTGVTVSRAIGTLQQDGYLKSEGRHGTFVTADWIGAQAAVTADGGTGSSEPTRPLRLGMVVDYDRTNSLALPIFAMLERLLTARVCGQGGTFRRVLHDRVAMQLTERVLADAAAYALDVVVIPREFLSDSPELPEALQAAGIHCIQFASTCGLSRRGDVVLVDDGEACRTATQRLIALGHTRIGYAGIPADFPYDLPWVSSRRSAWEQAMAAAALPVAAGADLTPPSCAACAAELPDVLRNRQPSPMPEAPPQKAYGYTAAAGLDPARHSAVICANDSVAVGLIHGLRERGLRVPEDISVIGYDNNPDTDPHNELTTFMAPEEQLTDAILGLATRRLAGEKGLGDAAQVAVSPVFISRGTIAPPTAATHPHSTD